MPPETLNLNEKFKMWITNGIAGVCSSGADIFNTIEGNLAGVPVIGATLATPFGYFSDRLREAKGFFYDFGDWADDVVTDISAIFGEITNLVGGVFDIQNWKDIAQGGITTLQEGAANFSNKVTDVLGSAWTDMKNLVGNFASEVFEVLGDAWDNLMWLYDNFRELVADVLEGAVMSFTYAGTFIQGTVVGFVSEIYINAKDLFENFVDYIHAGVVNWSETQYEEVVAIALRVIDRSFSTFEQSLTFILMRGFEILDHSWSMFEDYVGWLVVKIVDMICKHAEIYAAKMFDMLEKIIEKM